MNPGMKIAALQMVSSTRVADNLERAGRLIGEAALAGARLVALPEYFCFMGRADRDKLEIAEEPGRGPIQDALAQAARAHRVWVIGGTLPLRSSEPERVLNANGVWSPEGTLAARYDKIHLFRYDNGRERYDEGRVLRAGDAPVALDVEGWRVGLSVCYDLRFPELYRALSRAGAALLTVPAAFTLMTGKDHWEVLLRARAIENQAYVLAPAQGGRHTDQRVTYGHAMVVDPWGLVVARAPDGEGLAMAEVDAELLARVRKNLPALRHQRLGG